MRAIGDLGDDMMESVTKHKTANPLVEKGKSALLRDADLVAVIPAYNEEKSIAKVILQTWPYADRIVVCDDGSTDDTAFIAERLGAVVIRHEKNQGKGVALRDAFSRLGEFDPDIVVTLDADGQHDPSQIPRLIEPILSGKSDMVIGSRYLDGSRTDPPAHRRFGLWMMNKMTRRASSSLVGDSQSGFRAFSRKAFKAVSFTEEKGFGIEQEQIILAFRNGIQVAEVPIDIKYNGLAKTSTKTSIQHGEELLVAIVRSVIEEKPLLYIGAPGLVLALVGFVLVAFELWLFNATHLLDLPIGLASIASVFLGVLLMVAGLIFQILNKISDLLRKMQT